MNMKVIGVQQTKIATLKTTHYEKENKFKGIVHTTLYSFFKLIS